jgi:hypothetical protein
MKLLFGLIEINLPLREDPIVVKCRIYADTVKHQLDTVIRGKQQLILEKTQGLNVLERDGAATYARGEVPRFQEIYAPQIKSAKEELAKLQQDVANDIARVNALAENCK